MNESEYNLIVAFGEHLVSTGISSERLQEYYARPQRWERERQQWLTTKSVGLLLEEIA